MHEQGITNARRETPRQGAHVVKEKLARGEEAAHFLGAFGWHLTLPADDFVWRGDVLAYDDIAVTRYWHTAGEFTYAGSSLARDDEDWFVVCGLTGVLHFDVAGEDTAISSGRIAVMRTRRIRGARCEGPVACLSFRLVGRSLGRGHEFSEGVASEAYLSILASLVDSVLKQPIEPDDPVFSRIRSAVAQALVAVTAASRFEIHGSPSSRTYSRALALILSSAADPSLTVSGIAARLNVSRTTLFRAFSESNHSPAQVLRQQRVATAMEYIQAGASYAIAARMSGFHTARRMRAAMHATGGFGLDDIAHANPNDLRPPEHASERTTDGFAVDVIAATTR